MRFRRRAIVIAVPASIVAVPAAVPAAFGSPTRSVTIGVGTHPYAVAVAAHLGEAFVADDFSVSVIDTSTRRVVATIPTGAHDQTSIAMAGDDTAAYVGAFHSEDLTVINTRRRTVARKVHVGAGAVDIVVADPVVGQRAYVAQLPQNRIAVIRTSDDTVVGYTSLPHGPQTLTTTPGSRDVWVGSSYSGQIWDLSTSNARVRRTLDVTNSTFPDNPATGQVRTIDGKHYRLGTLFTTGTEPVSLTIDPQHHVAYTANYAANTVTVFDTAATSSKSSGDRGTS
jgi:YVTN family beta-propeller protein